PATARSRIVHDSHARRLVVITISKHSPAQKWNVEGAEVGGTYSTRIDLRRVVRFIFRTAFQLDRHVVWTTCNTGRIQWVSRRHRRVYHARLLTCAIEYPPEIVAELRGAGCVVRK